MILNVWDFQLQLAAVLLQQEVIIFLQDEARQVALSQHDRTVRHKVDCRLNDLRWGHSHRNVSDDAAFSFVPDRTRGLSVACIDVEEAVERSAVDQTDA